MPDLRRKPRFSALQRAENSSIAENVVMMYQFIVFQCSSASRKFLNRRDRRPTRPSRRSFSALQRAENSSIANAATYAESFDVFQCSSASRKFLNYVCRSNRPYPARVSVLFSEPKIPQFLYKFVTFPFSPVSVLFSEPKIPQ